MNEKGGSRVRFCKRESGPGTFTKDRGKIVIILEAIAGRIWASIPFSFLKWRNVDVF